MQPADRALSRRPVLRLNPMNPAPFQSVGVVIIGRNEGERLRRCVDSVFGSLGPTARVVYVDSGSTDGSTEMAAARGCDVVRLPSGQPFTAGTARNAGADRLAQLDAAKKYLLFIDGDCELYSGFPAAAVAQLESDPRCAVAFGRRRERDRNRNIYHRLADMEWNVPPGPADACGGDAMMRAAAFHAVGGFDPKVIAGEEPELCVRLRAAGHSIECLPVDMTLHDVAMSRFGQWWIRSVRAGYAFANGALLHGRGPQRHWLRQAVRTWVWAALLPILVVGLCVGFRSAVPLLGLFVYLMPLVRSFRSRRSLGDTAADAWLYAAFCLIGKFAELRGHLKLIVVRLSRRDARIIEYKAASVPTNTSATTSAVTPP